MNCPYCGGALEKGTLHSRGGEYFLPDGAKLPAWFTRENMEKVGAVGLTWNPALTQREWPEAYCCRPGGGHRQDHHRIVQRRHRQATG